MANVPSLANSFVAVFGQFQGGGFTGAERQVLLLSNAVANRCAWAVAFHSTAALAEGVPAAEVEAIRRGERPADERLAALSVATRRLIDQRGHLEEGEVKAFTAAGFDDVRLLEVIMVWPSRRWPITPATSRRRRWSSSSRPRPGATDTEPMSEVGVLVRHWRKARRLSQLALGAEAAVSVRHLCFIETGRARPSRAMVLKLAEVLEVPLRERNTLLLAAGFAPEYQQSPLGAPALAAALPRSAQCLA